MEQELLEAKCRLYGLLLQKGSDNWTAAEVDIAFHLSIDQQVQQYLQENLRPAAEVCEEDLSKCPQCGGEADNGQDCCIPPSAYMCSKCCAQEDREKQDSVAR